MEARREVTVRLFARMRELFQESAVRVEVEDAWDVGRILRGLCATAEQRQGLFQESGALRTDLTVLLNGHNVALSDGEHTEVCAGDEVAVFPPIYGG